MSLSQEVKDEVKKAVKSNKLDFQLKNTLLDILEREDSQKMDEVVACLVKAKQGLKYEGLNRIAENIYTARTSYKKLVKWVNSEDFYVFESSQKLRLH